LSIKKRILRKFCKFNPNCIGLKWRRFQLESRVRRRLAPRGRTASGDVDRIDGLAVFDQCDDNQIHPAHVTTGQEFVFANGTPPSKYTNANPWAETVGVIAAIHDTTRVAT
jgi:hypothetical protein